MEYTYNLRRNTIYEIRLFRTQKYGIESLASTAPKIWLLVSRDIKSSFILNVFKSKVKNWLTQNVPVNSARDILKIVAIYKIYNIETRK